MRSCYQSKFFLRVEIFKPSATLIASLLRYVFENPPSPFGATNGRIL